MALSPPISVVATVISISRIDLAWRNVNFYNFILIYREVNDAGGFLLLDTVAGSLEYYEDSGLTKEVKYCYKLKGLRLWPKPQETSGFSGPAACGTTPDELAAPSGVVATAISDTEIDVTFKDNSADETLHRLQRKVVGDGGWVQIVNLEPNREFYRDTTAVKGVSYTYQVRADGLGGPTADVESNPVTTISEPLIPTLANIIPADIKDKSIRIRWSDVANETGYRIEMLKTGDLPFDADEADLIAVVGAGVTDFLATGLDVGTAYSFRVRAYNAAGNGDFSAIKAATTDAVYVPTEFEKWIRNPNIEPVYLAEIYAKMTLDTFTPTAGKNKTFEREIDVSDRGIDILEVFEGDKVTDPDNPTYVSYTAVVDTDAVQATAKTFFFHYANRILYVHTSDDSDPDAGPFLIEAAFWLYFSTHKDIEFTVDSGRLHHFLPLLSKEDIPDITQEIKPYFEGSFSISSGSIAFKNGTKFFDKIYATYTWMNAKIILKAGRDDFTYDLTGDNKQFKEIFTAYVDRKSCTDAKITFQLRDVRKDMAQSIVLNKFTKDAYPGMVNEEGKWDKFIGKAIPIGFGSNEFVVPIAIDIRNGKLKFNDTDVFNEALHTTRSKSVEGVKRNGVELIEDTHYYVDLQRSIITFERDGRFIIETGVNDMIDFKENAVELHATLDPDTYTADGLCDEIERVLELAGGLNYTITCPSGAETPKKFTIAADAEFSLLWRTGTNGADGTRQNVGETIGFRDDEDSEGEESYEADDDVITITTRDIVEVSFTGFVNSADEVIENGAEIFKYLMNKYKEIEDSELNLDSIYQSKYANTNELFLYLETESSFDEIVRTIEHSIEAYTFQDEFGRLGIKPQQTTVASNVKYIISPSIFSHSQSKDKSSLFWKVIVYYNKNSQDDSWESKEARDDTIDWKYRIKESLEIYTYFSAPAYAQALATSILTLLNTEQIDSELPMLLFDVMAGDIVKFSRTRFYDKDGEASEISLRIIRISKSPASGKTTTVMEIVN